MKESKRGFRESVLAAADRAYHKGDIRAFDVLRLRLHLRFPRTCEAVRSAVIAEIMLNDQVNAMAFLEDGSIDWDAIADFLEKVLPIILEFIIGLIGAIG